MLNFHPAPETEKGQVQDLQRQPNARVAVRGAYVRVNPAEFDGAHRSNRRCSRGAVDPRELRRAQEIFREDSPEVVRPRSRRPQPRHVVAAAGRRRFRRRGPDAPVRHAHLRAVGDEAEDISLFDRKRHRNIAVYASKREAGAARPASTTKTISSTTTSSTTTSTSRSTPDRQWIDGRARAAPQGAAPSLGTLTLRLAESLVVAVGRQRRVRPAVRPAREEPEHAARQPADAAGARHAS